MALPKNPNAVRNEADAEWLAGQVKPLLDDTAVVQWGGPCGGFVDAMLSEIEPTFAVKWRGRVMVVPGGLVRERSPAIAEHIRKAVP
jgi:hypothetical protein